MAGRIVPLEQGATGTPSHNRFIETPRGAVISQQTSAGEFA